MRLRVQFWLIEKVVVAKLLETPLDSDRFTYPIATQGSYSIYHGSVFSLYSASMYIGTKPGDVACIRFPTLDHRDAWLKAIKSLIAFVNGNTDTTTEVLL